MLKDEIPHEGGRPSTSKLSSNTTVRLEDIGINRDQSSIGGLSDIYFKP